MPRGKAKVTMQVHSSKPVPDGKEADELRALSEKPPERLLRKLS